MPRLAPPLLAAALAALVAVTSACDSGSGGTVTADTLPGFDTAAPPDASTDGSPGDTGPTGGDLCPAGHATLIFAVDDSANQTYTAGELIWTGSFSYDEATNLLTYATSWLPDQGPFPTLMDDGPWTDGGHEPAGAVAGDHVWSIAACYEAVDERAFDYGLLNADFRWIWVGPNGRRDVPAGTTGVVDFGGQTIEAFGDRDFRVRLDLAALHPDYAGVVGLGTHRVFLKGTMNGWAPVQLLDDGQLGDAAAGDGVVTYQHGSYLGPHDGLLRAGQEAQFVFVFALEGIDPDDALEYKDGEGNAAPDGVSAEGACDGGWIPQDVVLSLDSKGVGTNTAVVVCAGDEPAPECSDAVPCTAANTACEDGVCVPVATPECDDQTPCTGVDEQCLNGFCVVPSAGPELLFVVPGSGSTAGGDEVRLQGQGFEAGSTVTFGAAAATVESVAPLEIVVLTPAGPAGSVDVTVTAPGGASSTFPKGFTYVTGASKPTISTVQPSSGPAAGGTLVTLSGSGFQAAATVRFGAGAGTSVSVSGDGKTATALTPAATLGIVDVTLTNPDGMKAVAAGAFTYVPELPDWGTLVGPPSLETVAGKPTEPLTAQVWEPGVTDAPGAGFPLTAEVGYGPAGSDPTGNEAWVWTAGTYAGDEGNNDVWTGSVAPPEGSWSATVRFSVSGGASWLYVDLTGAEDGFDPAQLAAVSVAAAGSVVITGLEPPQQWPGGGGAVTVSGSGFSSDCTVTLGGEDPGAAFAAGSTTFSFTAPPHPAGSVPVTVTCPDGSDALGLTYVATWDGALDEWPPSTQLAENTVASAWGADNHLDALYATTDGEHLLIGIAGRAMGSEFGPNAIVAYVDADAGAGTGVAATSALTDDVGAVDSALQGLLAFDITGFGAEVGFATLNMASYTPDVADPASVAAGWRAFADPTNMDWLLGASVVAGADGVEAVIPLADLLGPATGAEHTLALNVRIANADGTALSNQALPEGLAGEGDATSTAAATLTVTW